MADREARKCDNCGALAARSASRFCEYCGTELPLQEDAGPSPSESPLARAEARFVALDDHPETVRWMSHIPSFSQVTSQYYQSVLGIVLLLVIGSVVTLVFFATCPPLGFIPLALLILMAITMSKQASKASAASGAEVERVPALVIDERTKITGGGQNNAARTLYFATLQFRDGSRRELDVFDELAGKITQGDAGIAFLKGDFLVDFGRVPV